MGFIRKLIYTAGIIGCLAAADHYNIPSRMIGYYNSKKEAILPEKGIEGESIKDVIDQIEHKDSIFHYMSRDKDMTSAEKIEYLGIYYENLSPKEKWMAAKEIARKSIK